MFGLLLAFAATVITPKLLCDGYEVAPAARGVTCPERDALTRAKQQCLELLEFSISEKRARIDQAAATSCIAARRAHQADRSESRTLGDGARAACAKAIVGHQREGQACESVWECDAALACVRNLKRPAKGGLCAKPLAPGTACDDDAPNGSALHALLSTQRPPCGPDHTCAAPPSFKAAVALTCIPRTASGSACSSSGTCALGLRCSASLCIPETRAAPLSLCTTAADCLAGDRCDASSRCAATPPASCPK